MVKKKAGSKEKAMSGDVMLDPRLIRFTHSRIRPLFSCGRRVEDTLESLRSGTIRVADLPRITVIEQDGEFFSMNNRRLWVYKQLAEEGRIWPECKVPVRIKAAAEVRAADRFTTDRCSFHAKFMYEKKAQAETAAEGQGQGQAEAAELELSPVASPSPAAADVELEGGAR